MRRGDAGTVLALGGHSRGGGFALTGGEGLGLARSEGADGAQADGAQAAVLARRPKLQLSRELAVGVSSAVSVSAPGKEPLLACLRPSSLSEDGSAADCSAAASPEALEVGGLSPEAGRVPEDGGESSSADGTARLSKRLLSAKAEEATQRVVMFEVLLAVTRAPIYPECDRGLGRGEATVGAGNGASPTRGPGSENTTGEACHLGGRG